jgi:hypothetical protein
MSPDLAIANNVALYGSIFRAHGLESRLGEHYWSTDDDPPPYYSRLVTTSRGSAARHAQLSRLRELAASARGQSWGCKDSFDELPESVLGDLGLRVLFRASWYRWNSSGLAPKPGADLTVQRVTTAGALLSWEDAWRQSSPAGHVRVFPDRTLEDANLELMAVSLEGCMTGGFILNHSDTAVGFSNFFEVPGSQIPRATFLGECLLTASRLHPDRALVGFEGPDDLDILVRLGAVPLGSLAVWASG